MNLIFYIAGILAVAASLMSITNRNAIHALLYLILSLLSISVIFYISGAPFIAALEVIVYAGAIMVLFIFVVMMLNIGMEEEQEKKWLTPGMWVIPVIMSAILMVLLVFAMQRSNAVPTQSTGMTPKQIGVSLFTTYLLAVEISAILLLAGIIGAYRLGKQKKKIIHRFLAKSTEQKEAETQKSSMQL